MRRRELLEAILARPDDDDLRLVYADVVAEEDGDAAHAELIQAQIELARRAKKEDDAVALRARIASLEAANGRRIAGAIATHARQWWFDRGLVSRIKVDLPTLAAHADELLGSAPVREILLSDAENVDEAMLCEAASIVARSAHLARVIELDAAMDGGFSYDEEGTAFAALLASPHLINLRRLDVDCYCRPYMAPAIAAAAERLPALRELVFGSSSGSDVEDDGAIALAGSSLCARLEVLELWGAGIGPKGIAALLSAPLRSIRRLGLGPVWYASNEIGPKGARALATCDALSNLQHLDLAGNVIRDEGVEAIVAAPWLATVTELDLSDNHLTDAALHGLARSPYATSLERLCLARETHGGARSALNTFTPAGLRALGELPRLRAIAFEQHEWLPLPLSEEALARAAS